MMESESSQLQLFEQVRAICSPLGTKLCEVQKRGFQTTLKADDSPVTEADLLSHRTLVAALPSVYTAPIVSEEDIPDQRDFVDYWLIDPIDGTKEFISGTDEFAIHIALIRDGKPYLGFVYVPGKRHAYAALSGGKAYKYSGETWNQIQARKTTTGLIAVESRLHKNPEGISNMPQYDIQETTELGSSLKILAIAEGVADVYIRALPTKIWDTVPPQIILQAAGGDIIDFEGNTLRCSLDTLTNPSFQAVNAGILSKNTVY